MTPYIIYIINKIRYIPPPYIFFEKKLEKEYTSMLKFTIFGNDKMSNNLKRITKKKRKVT